MSSELDWTVWIVTLQSHDKNDCFDICTPLKLSKPQNYYICYSLSSFNKQAQCYYETGHITYNMHKSQQM